MPNTPGVSGNLSLIFNGRNVFLQLIKAKEILIDGGPFVCYHLNSSTRERTKFLFPLRLGGESKGEAWQRVKASSHLSQREKGTHDLLPTV
jgi:hypothetical protein